ELKIHDEVVPGLDIQLLAQLHCLQIVDKARMLVEFFEDRRRQRLHAALDQDGTRLFHKPQNARRSLGADLVEEPVIDALLGDLLEDRSEFRGRMLSMKRNPRTLCRVDRRRMSRPTRSGDWLRKFSH